MSRNSWIFIWVTIAFVVLTVIFTWPLVLHMGTSVVGRHGDNMHFAWMVGWFERALLQDLRLPYEVPILNYPEGWNLARSEIPTTLILIGLLPGAAGEPVLGYNVAVLASFFLTGVTTYLWLQRLTESRWAAFFGGAAFAIIPFRFAHFRAGHLNILATMWFPLIFMGLFEILRRPEASYRWAALSAVSLGLLSHSSQYLTYVTLLVIAAVVATYVLGFQRRLLRSRRWWRQMAVVAAVGGALVFSGAWPYLRLSGEGALGDRSVFAVVSGSASVSDYILPATDHFLWGGWVGENFSRQQWIEGTLYVGAVTGALAVWALWKRGEGRERREVILLLVLLAVFALIISLGTHLHWNEEQVRIGLPETVQKMIDREDVSIRLPGFYLYDVLPYYDRLRTFKRTGVLVLLAVCVLGSLGLDRLQRRWGMRWVPLAAMALLALDFYPGPFEAFARVEPRPVDRWLAEQPGEGAVVEFPFHLQTDQLHVYYTLEHGKPYVGGFFNAFPPPQYRRIRPLMAGFPSEESVSVLREMKVRYVLVRDMDYESPKVLGARLSHLGLTDAGFEGGYSVYLFDSVQTTSESSIGSRRP